MISNEFTSAVNCPKCDSKVLVTRHESYDGAYDDYHCKCVNELCDYEKWEESGDA